jgi:type IV pilus assembly protein PilX
MRMNGESGAALIVSLLMLFAVLALGVSGSRIAVQGQKAVLNDRDRQLALQAAEAALIDAELDIEGGQDAASVRARYFDPERYEGFEVGCGQGHENPALGLCLADGRGRPLWQRIDLSDQSERARSVAYGRFTGRTFPAAQGNLPARSPRYIIELLPDTEPGMAADEPHYVLRITAIGFGARDTSRVVLQTIHRKGAS